MYNETPLSDQQDLPRLKETTWYQKQVCLYIDAKKNPCMKPQEPVQGRLHCGGVEMSGCEGQHRLVGMLDKLLSMVIEPLASLRSSRHATFSVAFTPGSDPYDTVNESFVHFRAGHHAETRGRDVAPSSPVISSTVLRDAALVDNEPSGKTPLLKMWC